MCGMMYLKNVTIIFIIYIHFKKQYCHAGETQLHQNAHKKPNQIMSKQQNSKGLQCNLLKTCEETHEE